MLSFMVFSMLLNSMSIIILQLSQNAQHTYTGLGILEFFKDIPVALVSIFLVDYIKKKSYYLSLGFALLICAVCSFSIPFLTEFWFLKIWFVLIGISFSIGKICVFSIIKNTTDTEKEFSITMSRTEAAFMLGIFIVNMEFALILSSDYQEFWRFGFWLVGIISLWSAVQFIKHHRRHNNDKPADVKSSKIDFRILTDRNALLFLFLISLIIFAEQIFNSWLPTFYKKSLNSSSFFALQSSAFLAFFSFLGRIVTTKFIHKFSPMKIFFASLVSGIILIISAYFISQENDIGAKILMFIFPFIGFFMAPLYPMLNSKFLAKYPEKKISRMVSFIILFTSLGGSIGSISTAYIFQKNLEHYYLLFASIPLILILVISSFFSIKEHSN
ncbi:MFS transporter [Cloacibacterium sp. TD35]|nr:MFS transporter [Cloacibacterium sp. TD35]WDT69176.1 MFS transporter [Cloacibacterium sp. TD35]